MKDLMREMDILEGVPPLLWDAAVREHLQRADQDGAGIVSAQDFTLWFLTEVAALLPLRDAFCGVMGLRPLYNQYHAVLLGNVGFSPHAARRPALGMMSWQFLRLAEACDLSGGAQEAARQAFKAARMNVGALRGASGGNTGGKVAEPSGGSRLQFAAFVRAVMLLAARRGSTVEAGLGAVMLVGAPPALPPSIADSRDGASALGLASQLEGGCTKEAYRCTNCGQLHARWRLNSWLHLEEYLLFLGAQTPVRRYLPYLPLLTARNLRAVFHRYNAKYNRGRLPPSSYRLVDPERADESPSHERGCSSAGAPPQAAYGACCCLFRSLTVMELSAWLRLCSDCGAIREAVSTHGSAITAAELEAAFLTASSIAGVYCPDDSAGLHDMPVGPSEGGAKLGLRRNGLGAVVGGDARVAAKPAPPRTTAAYQASPAVHAYGAAAAAGTDFPQPPSARAHTRSPPRLHEVRGPASRAAWLAAARSLPYDDGVAVAAAGGGGGSTAAAAHRPARLCLTFPQFLEALRLVAEQAAGHPTSTARAELALLRIVHDLVREGCPTPDPTTSGGTAQLRRQYAAAAAGAGGEAAGSDGADAVALGVADAASEGGGTARSYDSLPMSSHRQDDECDAGAAAASEHVSNGSDRAQQAALRPASGMPRVDGWVRPVAATGTSSASTSTKYTYDDFTPPDSDAYTSATSSRQPSRPASEAAGWGGRRQPPPQPKPLLQSQSLPPSVSVPPSRSSQQGGARQQRELPLQTSHSLPDAASGAGASSRAGGGAGGRVASAPSRPWQAQQQQQQQQQKAGLDMPQPPSARVGARQALPTSATAVDKFPGHGHTPSGARIDGWVRPAAAAGASSASTSTKYTYDDFTPPDSDAYTSATSSRQPSRPASEADGWGGRRQPSLPQPPSVPPSVSPSSEAKLQQRQEAPQTSQLLPDTAAESRGAGGKTAAAAAQQLPLQAAPAMPPSPSARTRTRTRPSLSAPSAAATKSPGNGVGGRGRGTASPSRTRPASAPRAAARPAADGTAAGRASTAQQYPAVLPEGKRAPPGAATTHLPGKQTVTSAPSRALVQPMQRPERGGPRDPSGAAAAAERAGAGAASEASSVARRGGRERAASAPRPRAGAAGPTHQRSKPAGGATAAAELARMASAAASRGHERVAAGRDRRDKGFVSPLLPERSRPADAPAAAAARLTPPLQARGSPAAGARAHPASPAAAVRRHDAVAPNDAAAAGSSPTGADDPRGRPLVRGDSGLRNMLLLTVVSPEDDAPGMYGGARRPRPPGATHGAGFQTRSSPQPGTPSEATKSADGDARTRAADPWAAYDAASTAPVGPPRLLSLEGPARPPRGPPPVGSPPPAHTQLELVVLPQPEELPPPRAGSVSGGAGLGRERTASGTLCDTEPGPLQAAGRAWWDDAEAARQEVDLRGLAVAETASGRSRLPPEGAVRGVQQYYFA